MNKHKIRPACFTLIELLVTMVITTVISAILIGAFHTGLMCYKKTDIYERAALKIDGAMSFIREDIKRFVPENSDSVNFKSDRMSFCILSSQSSHSCLQSVTYEVKAKKLIRTVKPYSTEIPDLQDNSGAVEMTVLDGVKSWQFGFKKGKTPRGKISSANSAGAEGQAIASGGKGNSSKSDKDFWPSMVSIGASVEHSGKTNLISTSFLMPSFSLFKRKTPDDKTTQNKTEASKK